MWNRFKSVNQNVILQFKVIKICSRQANDKFITVAVDHNMGILPVGPVVVDNFDNFELDDSFDDSQDVKLDNLHLEGHMVAVVPDIAANINLVVARASASIVVVSLVLKITN